MSTRSAIALKRKDGSYQWIYVHFDGYVAGNGVTLLEHYKTVEDVERLVDLGDLSSLGETPFDPGNLWELERDARRRDTYGVSEEWRIVRGLCEAFCKSYRSRPEHVDRHESRDWTTLKRDAYRMDCSYIYAYDGAWKVKEPVAGRVRSLAKAVADAKLAEAVR